MQKLKIFDNLINSKLFAKLKDPEFFNKFKAPKLITNLNIKDLFFVRNLSITFGSCIILSNIVNTFASLYLIEAPISKQNNSKQVYNPLILSAKVTYPQIQKKVIDRNIFNISGEIPAEDSAENNGLIQNFDAIACSKNNEKLPVELVGILFTGNPKTNLVTFKDPRIQTADVYHEGQSIIDNETYEVYKIPTPSTVQIRQANTKICLSTGTQSRYPIESDKNNNSDGQTYEFTSDFVDDQIGPGFSKILNSARLVPEVSNGKTIGFKIFAITAGSLFDKMNLENGDVITSVNGIKLEDPSQGFKLYEAMQDETNIIVEISRAGMHMTKKVTVR
ncbi:hypothetical protein [Fluviispira sanaruensis]|uniref:PDZ domain-containing protein n=1 Tax=Fluviispira sanaruensis TaxID=2493639 RepID=A0A4P2VT89_FLUSA|nr:hypothetical protein [Fluviispira sanaruensis]BBH52575.1 hypothetical protein JCM31447_10160 [Fluviispira sanaruensis]